MHAYTYICMHIYMHAYIFFRFSAQGHAGSRKELIGTVKHGKLDVIYIYIMLFWCRFHGVSWINGHKANAIGAKYYTVTCL